MKQKLVQLWVLLLAVGALAVEYGIAAKYSKDRGLKNDAATMWYTGFETENWAIEDFERPVSNSYISRITDPNIVHSGTACLELRNVEGTHAPGGFYKTIKTGPEVAYVRFYRRYEAGYDWTQHKMPGFYASNGSGGGAGVRPNGYDKFSCKLYVNYSAEVCFYSYHPDQPGNYGQGFPQNVGSVQRLQTGRWYCIEMMLKPNTPKLYNGEIKMWIDGTLKAHYQTIRFRDTSSLKINEFEYTAYVGGTWTSTRNQKLWDDDLIVATQYVGPQVAMGAIKGRGVQPVTVNRTNGQMDGWTNGVFDVLGKRMGNGQWLMGEASKSPVVFVIEGKRVRRVLR